MTRCLLVLITLVAANSAFAQIAVQQPVIENFSVGTTVSVPDRGSALLGGVGSAASGRTMTGPLRSGTSLGLPRQASTASVHVYIHDFEAMDAALLNSAEPAPSSRIDPRIAHRLQSRGPAEGKSAALDGPSESAAREAERLAEQAERRGKRAVAKLHWQRAARHGSTRAAQWLASH
jgi:hypothetical protein